MVVGSVPDGVVALLALVLLAVVLVGGYYLLRIGGRLVLAPGVVVHEFAHKKACDLVGVDVVEVVYFQFDDPPGYVGHAQPDRYRASFVISVAPFLVNTVISLAAFVGLAVLVASLGVTGIEPGAIVDALRTAPTETLALAVGLAWIGLAVGTQAFPSTGDANVLWTRTRAEWRGSPLVLLGIPVVAVIYLANLLSWLWADVLYAIGLAVLAVTAVGTLAV